MSRFIAVVHGWHVESKGFDVHDLTASTAQAADYEACLIAARRDAAFDRTAYVVVEVDNREHLPRRLTWREPLTGRIK